MKKLLLIFSFTILMQMSYAEQGDTIVIQTFEFEGYPVGEGWLSPREGYFDFTSIEGKTFAKVLMYYTLKCDPNQSPACGEWDYLSYAKVQEYTGRGEDPSYIIGGQGGYTPDNYSFMNDISWWYESRKEETTVWDNPSLIDEFELGTGILNLSQPFNTTLSDSRSMYLWEAAELSAAGMTSQEITGIQLNFSDIGESKKLNRLNIRIKHTTDEQLSSEIDTTGFTTVYSKDTQINTAGWYKFDFSDFFTWDGTSNLIIDIYFSANEQGNNYQILGSNYLKNYSAYSDQADYYFDFNGPDIIPLSTDNVSTIQDEITVSFWVYGNENIQPQNDCAFEARDADGNRILNSHLPWSNGTVYWDAGDDSGYDRIEKAANPEEYGAQWNHYAFTKNAVSGEMKIYLNGELWHNGTGLNRPIGIIDTFVIGRGLWNSNNFYDGKIDEFRVWNTELDELTISEWMHKGIDGSHPNYSSLVCYYKFDEISGLTTADEITAYDATLKGIPQRKNYQGLRFKNFYTSNERPNIKFNHNTSTYTVNSEFVVDSFPKGEVMIEKYIQLIPDEKPVLEEIIYVYPTYYNNYIFDANGNAIDSTLVPADETLTLEMIGYNTTDPEYEIVIPWEIGRFITPYGNNLSLGNDGWTWIYDVSDFQHLLQGDNVHIKAGNFQELLDMKFLFIEGTPPRDILGIENVYSGNYSLSNFDELVVDSTISLLAEGKMFKLRTTLTGHGFGSGANCAEFCYNNHKVYVNGNLEFNWQIIQECGLNPLFPQGGTWFYDRAGWCPGMPGTIRELELTPFINVGVDDEVIVDYDVGYDPYGNYVTEIFFVTYGDYNFATDVEIDDIIAPNTFKLNSRYNPVCGRPIIKIKNNGSNPLTSVEINYGINDQIQYIYSWTGNLNFGETEEVTLPAIGIEEFFESDINKFSVSLEDPNGLTDEYIYNNTKTTDFLTTPVYDNQIVIQFYSNKRNWENSYEILDTEGNIVHSKDDFEYFTIHYDTLDLDYGCYEFVTYDTGGDGMYDWPSGYGTGSISFYDIHGNHYINLEEWFGEEIRHQFVYTDLGVSIDENQVQSDGIQIYPNPAKDILNIKFLIEDISEAQIKVYDIRGKLNLEDKLQNIEMNSIHQLKVNSLEAGIYFISIISDKKNTLVKIIIE